MAVLRTVAGLDPGQLLPLEVASMILGRHPACDIVLESASVSRQHARILDVDGNFYIEDLHSRNGTFLNGQPVTQRQLLGENDEVGICDLSFIFHLSPPELNVASPSARRGDQVGEALMVDDDKQATHSSTIMSKLNVPSGSTGLGLEVNTEAKLKALIEISRHLGAALGLAEVLPKLLDSLFAIFFQADRGFIVLREPQTGRLVRWRSAQRQDAGALHRRTIIQRHGEQGGDSFGRRRLDAASTWPKASSISTSAR